MNDIVIHTVCPACGTEDTLKVKGPVEYDIADRTVLLCLSCRTLLREVVKEPRPGMMLEYLCDERNPHAIALVKDLLNLKKCSCGPSDGCSTCATKTSPGDSCRAQ